MTQRRLLQVLEREGKEMDTQAQEKLNLYPESDDAPQNGFLFIGELAKLTGTDPKTIRFYERAELISPPRHGRFRTYLASDVRRLKNVLTLRRLGVPIAQIRDILAVLSPEEDVLASEKAVSLLRKHLDTLKTRHAEVTQQIEKTHSALESLVA
jgi:DNA-binding transcriptional MerR regulator